MNDIFDLIRNKDNLPSTNNNMGSLFYIEVQPLRDVQDQLITSVEPPTINSKFGNGIISLRWTLDNRTWWIPNKSYLRFRIRILGKDGQPISNNEDIAPTMGICPSLVQKLQFKMNDTTVDSIDENLVECDSMQERLMRSNQFLNEAGNSVDYWNAYHKERLQDLVQQGQKGKVANDKSIEITNKGDLGYGPVADGINGVGILLNADGSLEFLSNRGDPNNDLLPKYQDVWKVGDVINIKRQGYNAYFSYYIYRVTEGELYVSFDRANPAQNFDDSELGGCEIERWRWGCASLFTRPAIGTTPAGNLSLVVDGAANSGAIVLAAGTWTGNVDEGDVVFLGDDAGAQAFDTLYHRVRVGNETGDTLAVCMTAGHGDTLAINAGAISGYLLKYDSTEITPAIDLGIDPADYNVSIPLPANAQSPILLNFNAIGAAPALNLRNKFRKGDLIIIQRPAADVNNVSNRFFWVQRVDTSNNNDLQMEISGSGPLGAAYNVPAGNGYIIKSRIRYCGEKQINNIARNKSYFEACWKPTCLGIFNYPGAVPGGTKFELEITPFTNKFYQLRGIETPFGINKTHLDQNNSGDYRFLVEDLKLYICQTLGPTIGQSQDSYYISLNEIKCHKQSLTTGNLTQTPIDVISSSYAFALAFQDSRAGSISYLPPSKFHVNNKEELNIKRYSIRFAGLSLPQPDAELNHSISQDYLVSSYIRNALYNRLYFKCSPENIEEWKERGIYFYHPFIRPAGNKETRAYVITDFGQAFTNPSSVRLLLFEYYQRVILIKMDNGRVYSIQTSNN